jgi:uncharacterized Zn-binding protein involved in type VI secretion
MGRPVQRVTDPNDGGGIVTSSLQDFVTDQGLPIAVDGSPVSGHPPFVPPHSGPVTDNGAAFVTINGIAVNRTGDADTCGHARAGGSPIIEIEE